tara:strand:- start:210 stop:860 length:651 start_codon:yes stop_codon:yes gene_type:complete
MNPIMNKDSREARRQERKNIRMANKGLRQERRQRVKDIKAAGGPEEYSQDGYHVGEYDKRGNSVEYGKTPRYSKKNPPDGSDASFGISGYVNNKKEFNSALNKGVKKIVKDKKSYNEATAPQDPSLLVTKVEKPPLNQNDPDKKMFLVNKEKTGTSKDTLFLPPGTYVSKYGYPEDDEVQTIAKKAAADGIYNYTNREKFYNFEDMEDGGKVKYKN